ncbi:MAG: hypothetical protein HYW26_00155 [Candidatus Aenigmarchaeota archaeon]|nr:hypothetical protein [Candidatus Aenigmarchaeota archaeon]
MQKHQNPPPASSERSDYQVFTLYCRDFKKEYLSLRSDIPQCVSKIFDNVIVDVTVTDVVDVRTGRFWV